MHSYIVTHSPPPYRMLRGVCATLALLCALLLLDAVDNTALASGAVGDACYVGGSTGALTLVPGVPPEEDTLVCDTTATPTTPVGGACVADDTRFYSGATDGCVTNNQSCSIDDDQLGSFQNGLCAATAPTPSEPSVITPPGGLTPSDELLISSSAPPGYDGARQSTLCVNASPFVGGGIGIVSGTVLCYNGDAATTNVYAYQTSAGSLGVGPISSSRIGGTWSGLTAQDFWATRNITAQGSIIAQGGALLSGGDTQILSASTQTGMQVTDAGVLIAAIGSGAATGRDATVQVEPGSIVLSASTPTESAQLGMTTDAEGRMRITQSVTDPDSSGFISVGADEITQAVIDAEGSGSIMIGADEITQAVTNADGSGVIRVGADGITQAVVDADGSGFVSLGADQLVNQISAGESFSYTQLSAEQARTLSTDGTSVSAFTLAPTEAQLIAYDRALLQGGQTTGSGYSGTVTLGEYAGDGITSSGVSLLGVYRNSPENIGNVVLGTADAGAVVTGVTTDPDGDSVGAAVYGSSAGSGDALILSGVATGSGTAVNIQGAALDTGAPAIQLIGSLTGETSVPSILIDGEASGSDSDSLRSRTGVLLTGSGNTGGSGTVSEAGVANWADVAIVSRNYETGVAQGLGTAIIVNDYGVDIRVAPLVAGQNDRSLNTFASGANNSAGTTQVNTFGTGGAGSVFNHIGHGGAEPSSVTVNTIGLGGGGLTENVIGSAGERGSVTNNTIGEGGAGPVNNAFGNASQTETGRVSNTIGMGGAANVSNTIGSAGQAGTQVVNSLGASGPGNVLNLIGTGSVGFSKNYLGNADPRTNVNLEAGGSEINLRNGIALTTIRPAAGLGTSVLPAATQDTETLSGGVLRGAAVEHAVVDSTGKVLIQTGPVQESTAAMVVVNGLGNAHGLIVTERQATLSGGTRSSSLTLDDAGARFSRPGDGTPIRVTGVADGQSAFDAVNIRQLHRAVAASMATAPQVNLLPGQFGVGVGLGHYGSEQAIGISFAHLSERQVQFNLSAAHGGGRHTAVRTGLGFAW